MKTHIWQIIISITVLGTSVIWIPSTSAHRDTGKRLLNDSLWVTKIDAKTDQDDGGGESEYCLKLTANHPGHSKVKIEALSCTDADWDATDPDSGSEWEDLNPPRLPLVGDHGAITGQWRISTHTSECSESESWFVKAQLYEISLVEVDEFLEAVGTAVAPAADVLGSVAGVPPGTLQMAGKGASILAKYAAAQLSGETTLSRNELEFQQGEGDASGTIEKEQSSRDFDITVEKRVGKIGFCGPLKPRWVSIPGYERKQVAIGGTQGICFATDASPLCVNYGTVTRAQLAALREAAAQVSNISAEQGQQVPAAQVNSSRRASITLVGDIVRTAVEYQLDEAELRNDSSSPEYAEAVSAYEQGEGLLLLSISSVNPGQLVEAISSFEQSIAVLAPRNYGEAFEQRWRNRVWDGTRSNTEKAIEQLGLNQVGMARIYLQDVVIQFQKLDLDLQEMVEDRYNATFGTGLSSLSDMPVSEATNSLITTFQP